MEIYFLKASSILALFLLFYRVFLKNETFFNLNRFFLLTGLMAALLLPLVTIRKEVMVVMGSGEVSGTASALTGSETGSIPWESILLGAYLLGMGYFLFVMVRQLLGLFSLMKGGNATRKDGFVLVPGRFKGAPFSFFRYIFYDPQIHQGEELNQILEHEKAHGRQLHSLDVLLGRIVAILLWANPIAWWYQKNIHQNLEYLADAQAVRKLSSVRQYQYTLLKVSGNPLTHGLVNAFYSSLIKKRIVMLQQNQSKTIHVMKYLLILPVLATFLMAFNRETVYVPLDPSPQELVAMEAPSIEVIIDKNTTDGELLEMKEQFKKDNIDFSYTAVRNEAGEIIDISFDIKGKAENGNPFSGSYSSDSDEPIKPIVINISPTGGIFFGQADAHKSMHLDKELHFDSNSGNTMVFVQKSGDSDAEKIEIRKVDGKEVYIVNEKEVSTEEFEEVYLRNLEAREKNWIKMAKVKDSLSGNKMIWVEKSDDDGEEVIEIRKVGGKEVIIVDGKEVTREEIHEHGAGKNVFIMMDGDEEKEVNVRKIIMDEDGEHEQVVIVGPDSDGNYTGSQTVRVKVAGDEDSETQTIFIDTSMDTDAKVDFSDSNALIIIDGKKASRKAAQALDPDQIETINVYKGDKAIEKYGKKAKNGVVEIQTKKE